MKKIPLYLLLVEILILICFTCFVFAEAPPFRIELNFDQPHFHYGENVGVTIGVLNTSTKSIWISKGFSDKDFFMEMRVIDPAGRLLIPKRIGRHEEFPDAPPLPYVQHKGKLIRVAPCENLLPGSSFVREVKDLRKYYTMELPGNYSFQLQISTMIFKDEICDSRDYQWLGMLKSEKKYIQTDGMTRIQVFPDKWSIAWKKGMEEPMVKVQIYPREGKKVADYRLESIRLNGVVPKKTNPIGALFELLFNARECIDSLGKVEVNHSYPVVISGKLKNGLLFGGGQSITVVE